MIVIDRFEGMYAVCETEQREIIQILKSELPPSSKEGDCLKINEDGAYELLIEESQKRLNDIQKRFDKLFK